MRILPFSPSLPRWPVAGLPEALNNCLVPAFFTPQALWEMKWRSAEVGAAFPVHEFTKVHAGLAVTPVFKRAGKWGMSCIRVIVGVL